MAKRWSQRRHKPLRGKSHSESRPNSSCFIYLSWTPVSKTTIELMRTGQSRKIKPNALGVLKFVFRRNAPYYSYTSNSYFGWAEWNRFRKSRSLGRTFNRFYRGRI